MAVSMGAYLALNAYKDRNIKDCMFLSPIVNLEYLIGCMFKWFNVTEEMLRERKRIETPVDVLDYEYYQYIKRHPIKKWNAKTTILYGGRDNLQSIEVIEEFSKKYGCALRISENSEHPFMDLKDKPVLEGWIRDFLSEYD